MWNFQNRISSLRLRKVSTEPTLCCTDMSDDDDVRSTCSADDGLECPICFESFNVVENVPYVLWCGHTLCQNCVLGLQWAVLKLPAQKIRLPFFVSCPWCNLYSFRWVHGGNLKYPRKNYFLLWMVESMNGDRTKCVSSACCDDDNNNQAVQSSRTSPVNERQRAATTAVNVERRSSQFSLHKSIDIFIQLAAKFPLVLMFLAIIFLVIPGSMAILALYALITLVLAVPSFLNLMWVNSKHKHIHHGVKNIFNIAKPRIRVQGRST